MKKTRSKKSRDTVPLKGEKGASVMLTQKNFRGSLRGGSITDEVVKLDFVKRNIGQTDTQRHLKGLSYEIDFENVDKN